MHARRRSAHGRGAMTGMQARITPSRFTALNARFAGRLTGTSGGEWHFDERTAAPLITARAVEGERAAMDLVLEKRELARCLEEHREFLEDARNDLRQCGNCSRWYTTLLNFAWRCRYHAAPDRSCCRRGTDMYLHGCLRRDHQNTMTLGDDTAETPLPLLLVSSGRIEVDADCIELCLDTGRLHIDRTDASNSHIRVPRSEPAGTRLDCRKVRRVGVGNTRSGKRTTISKCTTVGLQIRSAC